MTWKGTNNSLNCLYLCNSLGAYKFCAIEICIRRSSSSVALYGMHLANVFCESNSTTKAQQQIAEEKKHLQLSIWKWKILQMKLDVDSLRRHIHNNYDYANVKVCMEWTLTIVAQLCGFCMKIEQEYFNFVSSILNKNKAAGNERHKWTEWFWWKRNWNFE